MTVERPPLDPTQVSDTAAFPRITTGNREADRILGGGFPANSLNILMGEPGSGKTLFVEQLLFANAAADRPVLYLTTLSEPLSKVVTYLQRLPFYDASRLGTEVLYEDMGAQLASEGIGALVPRVRELILTVGPKLIVIDSFKAVHDLAESVSEMRRLISELAGLLAAYDTTCFLVGEYAEADSATHPEFAVADGVVEFARHKLSTRDERFLRVAKLRGSGYLEGLHALHISGAGVEVYPRLVSPVAPEGYTTSDERVSIGVAGLDVMLNGGVWRGSTTLVIGPTGAGKTTMGLQFALAGVAAGEPVLYVNFQENPSQLARAIRGLTPGGGAAPPPNLHLLYASSVELQIDRIIVAIFKTIERYGVRRVVIDAVGDLAAAAADLQRIHDYLYALVQQFAVLGVTVVLTMESPGLVSSIDETGGDFSRLSYMCDNIVLLEKTRGAQVGRRLSIYKTRGSGHDDQVRDMAITATGVHVR